VLLLIGAALLYSQSAMPWRENSVDSHHFAYCGARLALGQRAYLDVWDNKPPGIWWANALAARLVGTGAAQDQLVGGATLGLALVSAAVAVRLLYHASVTLPAFAAAALLLTHAQFECGANRCETLVIECELAAFAALLLAERRGEWGWLLLAGACAGAAPFAKQSGVALLALCLVLLLARAARAPRAWRHVGVFVAGIAAAWTAGLALLARDGAIAQAWFAVVQFNRAYFAVGDATWTDFPRAWNAYRPAWPALGPIAILLFAALIVQVRGAWRARAWRPDEQHALVLWLWLALSLLLALAGPGRQPYHLAPALAPAALLLGACLHAAAGDAGLAGRVASRPSVAVGLLGFAYVTALVGRDSAAEASRCWKLASRERPYAARGERIRELAAAHETIYVWGWDPGTYRFAARPSASRFLTLEKLSHVGEHAAFIRSGAIADFRARPPRVFVISPGDLLWLSEHGDPLSAWLRAEYRDTGNLGGMHILVRATTP
jgi:hypothetical protein